MLSILFQVGVGRYALEIRRVVEVVPRIPLRALPRTPPYLAGVFDYAGEIVPVIDLRLFFEGQACDDLLSTRIIVVNLPTAAGEHPRRLGLVAEKVSDIQGVAAPAEPSQHASSQSYLGPVVKVSGELVQVLRAEHLLTPEISEQLYEVVPRK